MRTLPKVAFVFALASSCFAGQFNLGAQFQGWNSNYASSTPFNGWEIWAPLSLSLDLGKDLGLYASGEFGSAAYTDSANGTETVNLSGLSDTVIGGELHFDLGSLPSLLNVGLNIPTGDQTWEIKQIASNIPTQFVDSRYRGRGFGASGMWGLSFPAGTGAFGASVGYLNAGAFNPNFPGSLVAGNQWRLGDSFFLALNNVQPFSGNQSQVIRLSGYYSLPTQQGGVNVYTMGININASYGWNNPDAFSFEVGGQYFFPGQIPDANGNFTAEPNSSYGPRVYFIPSLAMGEITLTGRAKYVFPNGYAVGDPLYATCVPGVLLGLEPSWTMKLDSGSALKLTVSYDYIAAQNAALDANNNYTSVIYNRFTFGANYEVKL